MRRLALVVIMLIFMTMASKQGQQDKVLLSTKLYNLQPVIIELIIFPIMNFTIGFDRLRFAEHCVRIKI